MFSGCVTSWTERANYTELQRADTWFEFSLKDKAATVVLHAFVSSGCKLGDVFSLLAQPIRHDTKTEATFGVTIKGLIHAHTAA